MTDNTRPPSARSRRAPAFALAAATATVLGVTASALPAVAAAPAPAAASPAARAATVPLTDGTLDWGIKKSFRDYLAGPIADGSLTPADGARTNADGSFRFASGEGDYDTATHAVSAAFRGSVHLYGHHGALDIALSGFRLETRGSTGTLRADVRTGTGEDGTGEPERTTKNVALAALDLSGVKPDSGGGKLTFADVPATLTADGAEAFQGYYKKGEELDPVTLAVTPGGGAGSGGSGGSPGGASAGGPSSAGGTSTGGTGGTGGTSGGANASGGTATSPGADGPEPASGSRSGSASGAEADTKDETGRKDGSDRGTVVDGTLDWGVKRTFRDYVTGPIADGTITTSGGAQATASGYRFGQGSGTVTGDGLDAGFQGGVRFRGHKEGGSYSLDLTFSGLKVTAKGTKGSLVADVRAKDRSSGEVTTSKGVTVASLKLAGGALEPKNDIVSVEKAPATLTAAGAKAFGGFYQAGDALDPVTVAVSLDENAQLPGGGGQSGSGSDGGAGAAADPAGGAGSVGGTGGGGALASTGTGAPSGVLLAGAAGLVALGGTAVHLARRRNTRHSATS